MTSNRKGTWPEPSDDERCVDALLTESGHPADEGLRELLLQLRGLRNCEVPPPSAGLAPLLEHPEAYDVAPLEDAAGRRRNRHRTAFTALAVAASLGVAGGAAAGNDTVRRGAEATISTIVRSFTHPAPAPQAPAQPETAPAEPAAVVPSPDIAAPPAPGTGAPLPAEEPGTALPADPVPGASAPPLPPPAAASDAGEGAPSVVPGEGGKAPEPPAGRPAVPPAAQPPGAAAGDGAGRDGTGADAAGKGKTGVDREDVAVHPPAEPPSRGR